MWTERSPGNDDRGREHETRLRPGNGLRLLHGAGFRLGVVTNKPRSFSEKLLKSVGIDAMISALVAGDDGVQRKHCGDMLRAACRATGAEPSATLMIGDSENDVLAAREAGVAVWCVPYGYNEGRAVATLECDRMVATLREAAELLVTPAR